MTGLNESVLKIKTKIVSCHTADSKPVKQEVNGTVILPPLVFPGQTIDTLTWTKLMKYTLTLNFLLAPQHLAKQHSSEWRAIAYMLFWLYVL